MTVTKSGLSKQTPSFNLVDADIPTLLNRLELGLFTNEQLVKVLPREVRSISEVNPDALAIARDRDKERAQGRPRGLLNGLPILVKDIFIGNGRVNTTGSKFAFEAAVLRRLREAGAKVHAHPSVTEFLNIRASKNAPNGWALVTGQSLGISCEGQDPGGSSTGSGMGAALGLGAAATGAEASGSIASRLGLLEWLPFRVPRDIIKTKPFVSDKFEEALDVLRSFGVTAVDDTVFSEHSMDFTEKHKEVWNFSWLVNFRSNLNTFPGFMDTNPHGLKTIEDVIAYLKIAPEEKYGTYRAKELETASQLG
ncbi:Fc.00g094900.m01.CDS01 [Cosmosporella sp. VM-42]